jgi:hypothetical protein
MKHAARVASQFIHGSEAATGGNEMIFPLTFREPYDAGALWSAFERLIRENTELQRSYREFEWTYCENLDSLLVDGQAEFAGCRAEEELLESFVPTGTGLPVRLLRMDDLRVALLVNHVFNNGATTLYWIEQLLAIYAGVPGEHPRPPVAPNKAGILSVAGYLSSFLIRASGSSANTVDFSNGRPPIPKPGYSLRCWRFSETQTAAIIAAAKLAGLSVTEALTLWLAESCFAAYPVHSRVCVSIPTDLTPWANPGEPGNHTGSLIVQLFRGANLPAQVRESFRWARKGVPIWLPQLIGLFSTDRALFDQFSRKAATPIPRRAPFENFTFAVSSVGVIRGNLARQYLSEIAAFMKTQTIFLCAMTLAGRMNWRVTVDRNLFQPDEAFELVDQVARRFGETAAANLKNGK